MYQISCRKSRLLSPLFIALATIVPATAQITSVVNAASQTSGGALAPGTIVSIFGTNLAPGLTTTPGTATPPATLGGVTVKAGGVTAPLYFVSPGQINAVLSFSTPTGAQTLTVSSSAGTFSTNITVSTSAQPGIFSLLGTGTGDGAIINPLTLAIGTFTVLTGENHTFLSVFLTGLDTTVTPVVTIGGVSVKVLFSGASPCCFGLEQINVELPASLSGAGRVPLAVQAGAQTSNTVEIVLLPAPGQGPFSNDVPDQPRSRELATVASIPGTSLALVTDEDDDVIRVIDVSKRTVVRVVTLPSGSGPVSVAVNATGTMAVVAERRTGKIALVDLTKFMVTAELAVAAGPVDATIAGNLAVVVNGDAGSVSVIDLTAKTVVKTIATGAGVHAVTADATAMKAWVTNGSDGTITVVDLVSLSVSKVISLGANLRVAAIQRISNSNFLAVAVPAAGGDGQVLIVNINDGTFSTISVNPDRSGGSSDIAISGSTLFFANQTGGSISAVPITLSTGIPSSTPTSVKVDLGARALAVDAKDNVLLVVNEGSGTIVLVDLTTLTVAGRINGIQTTTEGDDGSDDHSDHDHGANMPVISAVSPATAHATSTFTLTVTGTNLAGSTKVLFVNPASIHGNGKGQGKGDSPELNADTAFSVTGIVVNAAGTSLTATVAANAAAIGPRAVIVETPNGESAFAATGADVITITP